MANLRFIALAGLLFNVFGCSFEQAGDEATESVAAEGASLTQSLGCCLEDGVAAVSLSATRTDVFGVGLDSALWRRTCFAPTCTPSQWTEWAPEPGAPTPGVKGRPAAISMRSGRIDVFVRGGDDSLWQRAWFEATGWSNWFRLLGPGTTHAGPGAASTGTNNLDVFFTSNGTVRYRRCSDYTAQCIGSGAFGSALTVGAPAAGIHATYGEPAVVKLGGTSLQLFVTGGDSALYTSWFIAGFWSPWEYLDGWLWSSPATPPDRPEVYVRGTDNEIWRHSLYIGWEQVRQPGLTGSVKSLLTVAGKMPVTNVFGVNPSNENAWEFTCSNTKYEPSRWNDLFCGGDGCGGTIQLNNNCYNYALDRITGSIAIPGRFAGAAHPSMTVTSLRSAALADGLRWVGWNFPGNNYNCQGGHLVHLGVKPNVDFHWWRLDRQQGTWSHKLGTNPATNRDASNNIITNPLTANRSGYTENGGFYCGCGDLATIH